MAGRVPDYHLFLSDREPPKDRKPRYFRVGAAWNLSSGKGLQITLNPGTVIDDRLLKEFRLCLFKNDERSTNKASEGESFAGKLKINLEHADDDDIPF